MADNVIKRLVDAGVEFTGVSQSKAESVVRKLVRDGAVRRKDAEAGISALAGKGKQTAEAVVVTVQREVAAHLDQFGARLDHVEHRVEELVSTLVGRAVGHESVAPEPPGPATSGPEPASAPAAKAPTRKAPAKRSAAGKQAPGKQAAPAKKAGPARKAAAKKAPAKKAPAKKAAAAKKSGPAKRPAAAKAAKSAPAKKAAAAKKSRPAKNAAAERPAIAKVRASSATGPTGERGTGTGGR